MSTKTISIGCDSGSVSSTTLTTTTTSPLYWTTTTATAPTYITYSGVYDPSAFAIRPLIKFGFYLKFKRSKAKLEKSWTEDTISFRVGSSEGTLKKLL